MKTNLEIEEGELGIMRFLHAAIKNKPAHVDHGVACNLTANVLTIIILADAKKVGHISEYLDNDPAP